MKDSMYSIARIRFCFILGIGLLIGWEAGSTPCPAQSNRLIRNQVTANWTEDGQQFWYETRVGEGLTEFWFVDAKSGVREPLFDQEQVAQALEDQAGKVIPARDWKTRVIKFDPEHESLDLIVAGRRVTIDRKSGNMNWSANDLKQADCELFLPPSPSRHSEEAISFAVHNRLDHPVEVCWIDFRGAPNSYGTVQPGSKFEISSYVTHVWLFRNQDQQNLGCLELAYATEIELDQDLIASVKTGTPPASHRAGRNRSAHRLSSPVVSANASYGMTSPAGNQRLEVRDHNLWLITDNDSSQARQLTTDGDPTHSFRQSNQAARILHMQYQAEDFPESQPDSVWGPKSRYVIAWQTRVVPERRVELKPSNPEQHRGEELSYPYAKPGDALPGKTPRLFDVTKAVEIPIQGADFSDAWSVSLERFSRNGKTAWIQYHQRGHQKIQILRVDLATGTAQPVIEETSPTFLHYSAGVKYRLWWLDDRTALWSSERTGWNHLYRIDMLTGRVLNAVTQGNWHVRNVETIRDGKVWLSAVGIATDQDPYHEHFCRVDLDGSQFVRLTEGDGMHSITWSPTGEYLVDQYSRVDLPPVHELRSAEGNLICELEQAEFTGAVDAHFLPQRFVAKGRDGTTDIWGVVHFPEDFDTGKRYPVLESIYAGPHDYHVPKRFRSGRAFDEFTQAGFVVVQIDGMGTAWRSKTFHDVCYRNLRDAGFPDRIAWIKALAEKHPNLDLSRVGIFGGSAGGQNAMAALLWHNNFYKVAVADCGCHDNRMDKIWWNEQWLGTVEPGNHYVENSNLENAHLLKGKLLLIVGELDRNVDPASTLDVAAKLEELGQQEHFELLAIPDTGHGAAESTLGRQRRMAFFKQHLLQNPEK